MSESTATIQRRLIEGPPPGSEQHPKGVREGVKRFRERFDHHHHPGPTAKRRIVNLPVYALAVFAEVVQHDFERALFLRLADEAGFEGRAQA